jgi:hypothetical protein
MLANVPPNEFWAFTDYTTGDRCFLAVNERGTPVVKHRKCFAMAAVIAELDAFYCLECRYSGRISGKWALDIAASPQRPAR